ACGLHPLSASRQGALAPWPSAIRSRILIVLAVSDARQDSAQYLHVACASKLLVFIFNGENVGMDPQQELYSFIGERDQECPAVSSIGHPGQQSLFLQLLDRLGHCLLADAHSARDLRTARSLQID